ncbi:MAG: type IV pilus biogenesis/stability protein PilW [Panacagrimonas sp.]
MRDAPALVGGQRSLVLMLAAGLLMTAACVTVPEEGSLPPRAEPDLLEAARLNTDIGIDYMRKGQLDAALEKLNRALSQNPGYALAQSSIAFVYARRGDAGLAETHYKQALQLESDNASTRNNFGVFLCGQKRYKDADKQFLQAAKNPKYIEPQKAWINAGVCARREPDLDRADAYFREALALRAEDPEALAQLASLAFERKDHLRTRAFLQRYEKVGPATAETLWLGAQAESALGDHAAADRYAARLKMEFPESEESARLSPSSPSS